MEKLLQWSIAQSTGDQSAIDKIGAPDPALLQQLFNPTEVADDVTLMKQNLFIMTSAKEADLENRIIACENFEMLIENLDNAMNLENLKMWEILINMLVNDEQQDEEIIFHILSIINVALQNNSKSQQDFMNYDQGLSSLIKFTSLQKHPQRVRLKALSSLSSLLRHNSKAIKKFITSTDNNFQIVAENLVEESNERFKIRALSLLSAILSTGLNTELSSCIEKNSHIVPQLSSLLSNHDLGEKSLNILAHDLVEYQFTDADKQNIKQGIDSATTLKVELNQDELSQLKAKVSK